MNGEIAYRFLSQMTENERQTVQIVWLDKEQCDNFTGDDAKQKTEFFMASAPDKQERMLDQGLYRPNGDITREFDAFLDGFVENFEKAVGDAMREADHDKG